MTSVGVVIPIGPSGNACEYLSQLVESLHAQTREIDEIVIVDDMHGSHFLTPYDEQFNTNTCSNLYMLFHLAAHPFMRFVVEESKWRLGIPAAFNMGIGASKSDLVIMLGADDWLEPQAVEKLVEEYERQNRLDAYYSFTIKYSDTDEVQDEPCNCAAVTKGLWKLTGGFAPESAVGACDSMFISMMLVHHRKLLIPVDRGNPLVNYRRHAATFSNTRPSAWQGPIFVVRDLLTTFHEKPEWGRYE